MGATCAPLPVIKGKSPLRADAAYMGAARRLYQNSSLGGARSYRGMRWVRGWGTHQREKALPPPSSSGLDFRTLSSLKLPGQASLTCTSLG